MKYRGSGEAPSLQKASPQTEVLSYGTLFGNALWGRLLDSCEGTLGTQSVHPLVTFSKRLAKSFVFGATILPLLQPHNLRGVNLLVKGGGYQGNQREDVFPPIPLFHSIATHPFPAGM